MLVQDSASSAGYSIAAEHTFAIVLAEGATRVLSSSEQPEETSNVHRSRASGTNIPVGYILIWFRWPLQRVVRARRNEAEEEEGAAKGGTRVHSPCLKKKNRKGGRESHPPNQ